MGLWVYICIGGVYIVHFYIYVKKADYARAKALKESGYTFAEIFRNGIKASEKIHETP